MLDFLDDLDAPYHAARDGMLALLTRNVPANGPPREPLSKHLGDGIYEFRKQPKGKKLRVVYFFDKGQVVICTSAFTKAERTPPAEIDRAKRFRSEYHQAKTHGDLQILDLGRTSYGS